MVTSPQTADVIRYQKEIRRFPLLQPEVAMLAKHWRTAEFCVRGETAELPVVTISRSASRRTALQTFSNAWASIWRARSRETRNVAARTSRGRGSSASRRISRTYRSRSPKVPSAWRRASQRSSNSSFSASCCSWFGRSSTSQSWYSPVCCSLLRQDSEHFSRQFNVARGKRGAARRSSQFAASGSVGRLQKWRADWKYSQTLSR
jgi:hypothetical protein